MKPFEKPFASVVAAWALAATLFAPSAHAARWSNQFIEFELPPQWNCTLEASEWICQSADAVKKKEAIIVIAAKLKGDQDSLDQYLAYLKQPKQFTTPQGRAVTSDVKYAKTIPINGHPWTDALHLESEIPGFYTRYLATIKTDIGVLLTYSIAKSKYQDYTEDFETLVKTLRVFRKPGGVNTGGSGVRPAGGTIFDPPPGGPGINDPFPPLGEGDKPKKQQGSDEELPLIPVLVGAAAVIFVLIRKRRRV